MRRKGTFYYVGLVGAVLCGNWILSAGWFGLLPFIAWFWWRERPWPASVAVIRWMVLLASIPLVFLAPPVLTLLVITSEALAWRAGSVADAERQKQRIARELQEARRGDKPKRVEQGWIPRS